MKNLINICLLILFSNILNAQSDFRDGYIINTNNDTIYGLIDYKGNTINSKKCIFKKDASSPVEIFTPIDIVSYRFTNSKFYVSKKFKVENEVEQLFLEYLINGIVDIFYYRDGEGEHYFVDDGTGNLLELKNDEREIVVENTRYVRESNEHIGLLKTIFKDSPSILKRLDNVELNHKSLIKITYDYHNEVCTDKECVIYEKKLPSSKVDFGMLIGFNVMSISQATDLKDDHYYIEGSQFGFKAFPSIGVYFKKNMSNFNERLYFQYEGIYSRANLYTSNSYTDPLYSFNFLNNIDLTQNIFNNRLLIKYEIPKMKLKPTLQIGGFVNYYFITDYFRDEEVLFSWGDVYSSNESDESPFLKYDYGLSVGIGLTVAYINEKELFVDLRYQRGFGLLNGLNTNLYMMNFGFQLSK